MVSVLCVGVCLGEYACSIYREYSGCMFFGGCIVVSLVFFFPTKHFFKTFYKFYTKILREILEILRQKKCIWIDIYLIFLMLIVFSVLFSELPFFSYSTKTLIKWVRLFFPKTICCVIICCLFIIIIITLCESEHIFDIKFRSTHFSSKCFSHSYFLLVGNIALDNISQFLDSSSEALVSELHGYTQKMFFVWHSFDKNMLFTYSYLYFLHNQKRYHFL